MVKRILFILIALLLSVTLNAQKWYVATAANGGSDTDGDGSITSPWLTIKHAADTVTGANFAGDTIFITVGSYTTNTVVDIDEEVNLMGEGALSVITTTNATANYYPIRLSSAADGTDGSQSVSYLKFDGNALTGDYIMYIIGRSNVDVHHCTFVDFDEGGVYFMGRTGGGSGAPSVYATGNKYHDNTSINCSKYTSGTGRGHLMIGGQDGMLVYKNTFNQMDRACSTNGYLIKYASGGYNKNLDIYDNVFQRKICTAQYNIAIEFWESLGGIKIHDNIIIGGTVDFAGNYAVKGASDYSVDIYNNCMALSDVDTLLNFEWEVNAVTIEGAASDVIIRNNYMRNFTSPIGMSAVQDNVTLKNVTIYNNIISNWGYSNFDTDPLGAAVTIRSYQETDTVRNIQFLNNTFFDDDINPDPRYVFWLQPDSGHIRNLIIKNNVLSGAKTAWLRTQLYQVNGTATIDSVTAQNNCLYNSATAIFSISATNKTLSDSIADNPQFISDANDFRIKGISPLIDAGLDVDVDTDYEGKTRSYPDVGAIEYLPFPYSSTGLGWESMMKKVNFKGDVNFVGNVSIDGDAIKSTANELNALVGIVSNVQGQIDIKANIISIPIATGTITDATGITAAMLSRYMYYSEAAATDITANPQIIDGMPGQIITIIGSSDVNTLTLDDGTGLALSAQCVLGVGDTITLLYVDIINDWVEIGRTDN